jgi:NAD+ diphosphatase
LTFISRVDPPDSSSDDALWLVVRDRTVCIVEAPMTPTGAHYLGELDERPVWCAAAVDDDIAGDYFDLFSLHGRVADHLWALAGRAVQIVDWDRTHRYCGACATPTEPAPGERARRCPACGLLAFPRLAPACIVLVERDDEVLLARGRTFGVPMYSCLAGFVEPGESVEETVHREVLEEVGVEVDDVRWFSSQPWPFPHSLMLGFFARWQRGDIRIQESEIVDAQWFRADDLPAIPPPISIARRLIDAWLDGATGATTKDRS